MNSLHTNARAHTYKTNIQILTHIHEDSHTNTHAHT